MLLVCGHVQNAADGCNGRQDRHDFASCAANSSNADLQIASADSTSLTRRETTGLQSISSNVFRKLNAAGLSALRDRPAPHRGWPASGIVVLTCTTAVPSA